MSKSILYVCAGHAAELETEDAVLFSLELEKAGYSSHFLAFPFNAARIRQFGLSADDLSFRKETNYRIFTETCNRIKPDCIVLADGWLFGAWFGPAHLFEFDWIIDNPVGARYASFDNLCISSIEGVLPIYDGPYVEDKFKWLGTRDLTGEMPLLISCPLAYPSDKFRDKGASLFFHRRPLLNTGPDVTRKEEIKKILGTGDGEKLIVLSFSGWALQAARPVIHDLDILLSGFLRLLDTEIERCTCPSNTVVFSPYPISAGGDRKHLRVIDRESVPFGTYLDILGAADLFITTDSLSSSLIYAAVTETPAVALVKRGVSPYEVFPLGLSEIAGPLFEDNPFINSFVTCDLAGLPETIRSFDELLRGGKTKQALQRERKIYFEKLQALPGPREVIENVLSC